MLSFLLSNNREFASYGRGSQTTPAVVALVLLIKSGIPSIGTFTINCFLILSLLYRFDSLYTNFNVFKIFNFNSTMVVQYSSYFM